MMVSILYVGQTWRGSSARSLREALENFTDVVMDDVGEDAIVPRHRSLLLRVINRLLRRFFVQDLAAEIFLKLKKARPDVLLVYKGTFVPERVIAAAKKMGVLTVNVFPDFSPHTHGAALKKAIGEYDLVISTKPFHPRSWLSVYGYSNRCEFVPHGYDSAVHFWDSPVGGSETDVVLAASWRPEYHHLMLDFAKEIEGMGISVGIAGNGWAGHMQELPNDWRYAGPLYGRAYGEWVRRAKIVLAPVHTEVTVAGVKQPGDEDTTRTYELAAAYCFFLHRRTKFAQTLYDEVSEVPMWDNASELAKKVKEYLPDEVRRMKFAKAAHARAVPAYSVQARANEVIAHIRSALEARTRGSIQ